MEIYVHTSEPRDAKNHPRPTCRKKQEAEKSKPHGGNAIESSYQGIGVAKCQQRRCQEADRQNSNGHLKPYGRRLNRWRRKRPRLIYFFQAEDGIRDVAVTGVQTCALPI